MTEKYGHGPHRESELTPTKKPRSWLSLAWEVDPLMVVGRILWTVLPLSLLAWGLIAHLGITLELLKGGGVVVGILAAVLLLGYTLADETKGPFDRKMSELRERGSDQ